MFHQLDHLHSITWKFALNKASTSLMHLFYAPGSESAVESNNAFSLILLPFVDQLPTHFPSLVGRELLEFLSKTNPCSLSEHVHC